MILGIPRETLPGENRVAMVPSVVPQLTKAGIEVQVEAGAGVAAGYPDQEYRDKGAVLVANRAELFAAATEPKQVADLKGTHNEGFYDNAGIYKQIFVHII